MYGLYGEFGISKILFWAQKYWLIHSDQFDFFPSFFLSFSLFESLYQQFLR